MGREWIQQLQRIRPRVHCLTNPVSMQDTANLLLAAGGSAIMAQAPEEVEEITGLCQATLLNTGVPDGEKFRACMLAGKRANALEHAVVLDPVGAGASRFRRRELERLLGQVKPTVIRCNQEEACALLSMKCARTDGKEDGRAGAPESGQADGVEHAQSCGVESSVAMDERNLTQLAEELARAYGCTVLVSGVEDAVSDGQKTRLLTGGDPRIARITGSGCMLSALCALFCGAELAPFDAAEQAGTLWKECSGEAGIRTDRDGGGMGSFHRYLFDALDRSCHESRREEP